MDGACSELECGCLDFGCDCVRVEHEAIREGGVPYGSDFLLKSVVYGVGVGRAIFVVFLCYFSDPFVGGGWDVLLDKVERFCGEDVEGGWGWSIL